MTRSYTAASISSTICVVLISVFFFKKSNTLPPSFHHFITTYNHFCSRFLYYVLQKCYKSIFPNCINARKPFVSKCFRAFVSHSILFPLECNLIIIGILYIKINTILFLSVFLLFCTQSVLTFLCNLTHIKFIFCFIQ